MNLLDNTPNNPSKFRTRNCVEINDDSRGTYSHNSQIRLKTSILKSSLPDYTDAYIHVKGTIAIPSTGTAANQNNKNEKVIFRNCARLISCISEINDNAKYIGVLMPMYNLIEYSNIYEKTSGSLWQCYRNEAALGNNNNIIDLCSNLKKN